MNLFRAYDLRGVYPEDINEKIAERVGKALGTFLGGRETVCVGFDTRASSKKIFKAFSTGLASTGCEVISLGLVTGPLVYFYSWRKRIFGCMITASHNPKEWNGFKFIKPNGTSFLGEIEKVRKIFEEGNFLQGCGKIKEDRDALEEYVRVLQRQFENLEGKIVVDFLGGTAIKMVPVFKSLNIHISVLHDKPKTELYGFHRLEAWSKLLTVAKEKVKKEKVDFGVAFDCDADRAVFISPRGAYVDPSVMNAIFIEYILKKRKGVIIASYDCAAELEEFTKKLKGKLYWCRVGHSFIEKKCLEEKALFAGEQSSHFYFSELYPFSDGLLAALYLAKILSKTGKDFNELISRIRFHPIGKVYVNVGDDEKKIRIVKEMKKEFHQAIDIEDGFKLKLNRIEWVMIRASCTMPEINICAQGKTKARLKAIVNKYRKLIEEKLKSYG